MDTSDVFRSRKVTHTMSHWFTVSAQCAAGSFSHDGFGLTTPECRLCPRGHYSLAAGSATCTQCPTGQTTTTLGSTMQSDCVDQATVCTANICGENGVCEVSSSRQQRCVCNAGAFHCTSVYFLFVFSFRNFFRPDDILTV